MMKESIEYTPFCEAAGVSKDSPVVPAVAVYASEFGFGPFGDRWKIDQQEYPAIYANPRSLSLFLRDLLDPRHDVAVEDSETGGQIIRLPRSVLADHIQRTLDDPMTEYLHEVGRINHEDIQAMISLQNLLVSDISRVVEIETVYPITDVLSSYQQAIRDPHSLLLLGWQTNQSSLRTDDVNFTRVTEREGFPSSIYPRAVSRITTHNHPDQEPTDIHDVLKDELGFYLHSEEVASVCEIIPSTATISFLGEVAKVPETIPKSLLEGPNRHQPITGVFSEAMKTYLQILTGKSSTTGALLDFRRHPSKFPDFLIFFTVGGTTTAPRTADTQSPLVKNVNRGLRITGTQYDETLLTFAHEDRTVYVSVMKVSRK